MKQPTQHPAWTTDGDHGSARTPEHRAEPPGPRLDSTPVDGACRCPALLTVVPSDLRPQSDTTGPDDRGPVSVHDLVRAASADRPTTRRLALLIDCTCPLPPDAGPPHDADDAPVARATKGRRVRRRKGATEPGAVAARGRVGPQ